MQIDRRACVCARARVRGKKGGSCLRDCVWCECGGGKKKRGGVEEPNQGCPRPEPIGGTSYTNSPICDYEGGHVALWSLRQLPATIWLLYLTSQAEVSENQKTTFGLKYHLEQTTVGPKTKKKKKKSFPGLDIDSCVQRNHLRN